MKKKITDIVVDILLLTIVFSAVDILMENVFHSENLWLELGIYIVFYAIAFGAKAGIVHLWKKSKGKREA